MANIIDYDESGSPIYGPEPKETGKPFDDTIKDLFWDVLGREPTNRELKIYRRDFGTKIDPDEEQIFFDRSQQEIQGRNDPILNLYQEIGVRSPSLDEYRTTRKQLGGDVSEEEKSSFLESYVDPAIRETYETITASDPVYRLFSQELGRKPTLQEYKQFQGTIGASPTDEQRMAVRSSDPETYKTRVLDQYRYMTEGYGPPPDQMSRLEASPERYNIDEIGADLAKFNLYNRQRYGASPTAGYIAQNLPSNLTPFTRTQGYVPLTRPNVSASMNLAGQQYYQTPTSSGVNYMGAPTNIAPITQGFQPVGMPSSFGGYGPFQPMGGKGGFQFQPQARSQQMPTQQFQPMGGKGSSPRPITGKG